MVHTFPNRQCHCNLLRRYPHWTHVSNRLELRVVYPPPTNPHWIHRLDRRVWFSWRRTVPVCGRRDNFEEGYSEFTASVSFFLSVCIFQRNAELTSFH